MVNKPKAIGTAAETAVRKYLLTRGFSEHQAHRNVLAGTQDQGDVWLRHPRFGLIVFEVKAGKAAKTASHQQCSHWLEDAEREARNAKGYMGVLVTQRAGVGAPRAGQWWLYTTFRELIALHSDDCVIDVDAVVRITLDEFMDLLDAA